jgi:cytoskeleton protein RodZ
MAGFGEKLRRERLKRKISLDDIAAVTKIGTRSLKALEDENFSILPGGIFNKSFVRAYARFLGMNEEAAVADYLAAANEQPVSVETIAAQSAMAKASRLAAEQASQAPNRSGLYRAAGFLVIAVAVAIGGFEAVRHASFKALKRPSLHRQMKEQAQNQAASSTPTTVTVEQHAAPLAPVSSASQPVATQAAVQTPAEFTVSIKTSEESWLSVTADGRRAFQRLFAPNEEQTVTARNKIEIKIGNPNGTEISLNGKPLALNGSLAHPRTVTVDASGLANE